MWSFEPELLYYSFVFVVFDVTKLFVNLVNLYSKTNPYGKVQHVQSFPKYFRLLNPNNKVITIIIITNYDAFHFYMGTLGVNPSNQHSMHTSDI